VDDHELTRRILSGDAQAERHLYDAHVDRIYRLAFRMSGDATLAEDLTQDAFLRAFDRLSGWRGDGPLGAWLHRVAVTVILGGLRRRGRVRRHETAVDEIEQLPVASPEPERDPALGRRLERAVAALDDVHRLAFVMHELEGFTHEEIAAASGAPVGTIKARLSRARGKLRLALVAGVER
jgi:RNA polymerase sigma-70 factor (ECF subfamily)